MILYLTLPVFVMILYGFNNIPGDRQTPRFWGFTLSWFANPFQDSQLTQAFWHSITIALITAAVSTPIGALVGLSLGRYRFAMRTPTNFVIFLAIAVPEIVLGSSLLTLFIAWNNSGLSFVSPNLGGATVALSHISFSIPFVAVTVRARVSGMDRSLEDAAQDLFATPVITFFKVTLPLIMPGIIAGALLAFVLSLDDFVITNFVSGSFQTFPIWVYGATRIGLPPTVNVIGTYLFLAGVVLALLTVLLQRRRV
jgi:spermidine/putrescine transport system permease protein